MKELDLIKENYFLESKDRVKYCAKYLLDYLNKKEYIDLYKEIDQLLLMLNLTYDRIGTIKDAVKSVEHTDNLHSFYEAEKLSEKLYGDMASE